MDPNRREKCSSQANKIINSFVTISALSIYLNWFMDVLNESLYLVPFVPIKWTVSSMRGGGRWCRTSIITD